MACNSNLQYLQQYRNLSNRINTPITINTLFYAKVTTVDKLQSKLTRLIEGHFKRRFIEKNLERNSKGHNARLLSVQGKHSGAFLRSLWKKGVSEMMNDELTTAFRFRLGLEFSFIPKTLRCNCKRNPLIGTYGQHYHDCNKGGDRNATHTQLVHVLSQLCSRAKVRTINEPVHCFPKDDTGKRPDMRCIQPCYNPKSCCRKDVVTDISVTHPGTHTHIAKHHSDVTQGISVLHLEKDKERKYTEIAVNNSLKFVVCGFESYGTWGEQLKSFVEMNISRAYEKGNKNIPKHVQREYWVKRISLTLQIMVARMYLNRTDGIIQLPNRGDDAAHDLTVLDCHVRAPHMDR